MAACSPSPAADLPTTTNTGISIAMTCMLVQSRCGSAIRTTPVADIAPAFTEWRGIIEAILGDWADAVIIEPRFTDQAYAHFDSNYKATKANHRSQG
jgi:hypothetical protein